MANFRTNPQTTLVMQFAAHHDHSKPPQTALLPDMYSDWVQRADISTEPAS